MFTSASVGLRVEEKWRARRLRMKNISSHCQKCLQHGGEGVEK